MPLLDQAECVLCGHFGDDVATALMCFDDGDGIAHYGKDPRCRDHLECRRRVELDRKPWPLVDELPTAVRRTR